MKRLHAHIFAKDLAQSTDFYNQLFDAQPDMTQPDYVRWQLQDPPMNFAISTYGKPGIDHLGIQLEDTDQLEQLITTSQLTDKKAEETSCCYARSTKTWLSDPQGIQWELFHTMHDDIPATKPTSGCCSSIACGCQ